MKKILIVLVLFNIVAFKINTVQGQDYIESDTSTVKIYSTGLNDIDNVIRWEMTVNDTVFDSGLVYSPDFWAEIDKYKIKLKDVGKNKRSSFGNFGLYVIWQQNLLELDKNYWTLKN
jgi:hypothetical protein